MENESDGDGDDDGVVGDGGGGAAAAAAAPSADVSDDSDLDDATNAAAAPSPVDVSDESDDENAVAPPPPRVPSPIQLLSSDDDEEDDDDDDGDDSDSDDDDAPMPAPVAARESSPEVVELRRRCDALQAQVDDLVQRLDGLRGEIANVRREHSVLLTDLCSFFVIDKTAHMTGCDVVAGIRVQVDAAYRRLQTAEAEVQRLRGHKTVAKYGDVRLATAVQELSRFKTTKRHLLFCVHEDKLTGAPKQIKDAARVLRELVITA